MKRSRSFAEIVADVAAERSASEPERDPIEWPGTFDGAGDLTDPDGRHLERIGRITPKQASAAVSAGALLAFEGCGCGGYVGCQPTWLDEEARGALMGKPRFTKRYGAPTWIDLWRGDGVEVVLAHGDVEW